MDTATPRTAALISRANSTIAVLELICVDLAMQHFLYFLPLPQWHGALRSSFIDTLFYMSKVIDGELFVEC
tara:strand:- start:4568 stop:4780 length:213 start_codon:yes stop_codon:yes gene_type:complete